MTKLIHYIPHFKVFLLTLGFLPTIKDFSFYLYKWSLSFFKSAGCIFFNTCTPPLHTKLWGIQKNGIEVCNFILIYFDGEKKKYARQ